MFWLKWVLTVFAFPIGGAASIAVARSLRGPVSAVVGGAIAGAIIGGAQWLVLRQPIGVGRLVDRSYRRRTSLWVLASLWLFSGQEQWAGGC